MAIGRGIGETGLVCVWLLSAIAVVGQTPAADDEAWIGRIRRDHPRMFFTRETWPDIVARTKGAPAASAALKNLILSLSRGIIKSQKRLTALYISAAKT